jgi:hypothetical protein
MGLLAVGLSLPFAQGCEVVVNSPGVQSRSNPATVTPREDENAPPFPVRSDADAPPSQGRFGSNQATATVEKTFKAGRVQVLLLHEDRGSITVEAGEADVEEIRIRAVKVVTGDRPSAQLRPYLDHVQAEAALHGDTLAVTSASSSNPLPQGVYASIHYTITVPERLRLDLQTETGAIRIHGVMGGAHLITSAGAVALEKVGGDLDVRTETGAITLNVAHAAGRLKLASSAGAIQADTIHAAGSALKVELLSQTGSLQFAGDVSELHAQTQSGAITVETTTLPLASADIHSEMGALTLTLPRSASAQVTAHSETGSVSLLDSDSQTPDETEADSEDDTVHTQSILIGAGRAPVLLNTNAGSITVHTK